jgi:hypothetical protein
VSGNAYVCQVPVLKKPGIRTIQCFSRQRGTMIFSVFCDVTQRRLVKSRRFGTTYQSHLEGPSVQEESREGKEAFDS